MGVGYLIDTIFNKTLSTEEKIARMHFALTFDWKQHPSENTWDTFKKIELHTYVKEYSFFEDYSPKDYQAIDVNEYDKQGWLPLSAAIAIKNSRIIDWLLEQNATINRYREGERPPMYVAVQSGDIAIFERLHQQGAHLLQGKIPGECIPLLELAIKYRQTTIVGYMLSVPEIHSIDNIVEIKNTIPLAKALRGKCANQENKQIFSQVILMLEKCYQSLYAEKIRADKKIYDAATKIQAAFHGKYIQTAYQAYINRPSLDVLLDNNKFEQAKKTINQIKKQKAILGLSKTVKFAL
ncbi:MAG: hypothetical protein RLZ35_615 [Pseudomonadota bacterium]